MQGNNFTYLQGFAGSGSGANQEGAYASIIVTIIDYTALVGLDNVDISTTPASIEAVNWTHGSSNNQMASNLCAALNANSQANGTPIIATVVGAVITIRATAAGPDGNTYSISFASNNYWSLNNPDGFFSGGA